MTIRKKMYTRRWAALCALILAVSLTACPSMSLYDHYAYTQATELKVESKILMSKAAGSFDDHKIAVNELKVKLDKAYEYEKGRPKNDEITKMWAIMIDPDKHMLGGFLKRWQDKGALGQDFINEAVELTSKAFDLIIETESAKIKKADALGQFLKL